MTNMILAIILWSLSLFLPSAFSTTITDIQGSAWLSPLVGQTIHNLTGLITAKVSSTMIYFSLLFTRLYSPQSNTGFYLLGDPINDIRVSRGLTVFTTSATVLSQISVGDIISLSGKVAEFRSSSDPDDLTTTELQSPSSIVVISSNNTVTPLVLGVDRSPPTQQLSSLDVGPDGWLNVPNNQSRVDTMNAPLQPSLYGMDFWSSLEGQLVTVRKPVAIDFENSFGEFWIHGDWPVTGKNSRGGISITFGSSFLLSVVGLCWSYFLCITTGPDGTPDANPEVIIIGSPLDGTKNPQVCLGKTFKDITGVIVYQ